MVANAHVHPRVQRAVLDWYFHGSVPRRVAILVEVVLVLINLVDDGVHDFSEIHPGDAVVVENEAGDREHNVVVINLFLASQRLHKATQHALVWVRFVEDHFGFEIAQCDYDAVIYDAVKSESEESSG